MRSCQSFIFALILDEKCIRTVCDPHSIIGLLLRQKNYGEQFLAVFPKILWQERFNILLLWSELNDFGSAAAVWCQFHNKNDKWSQRQIFHSMSTAGSCRGKIISTYILKALRGGIARWMASLFSKFSFLSQSVDRHSWLNHFHHGIFPFWQFPNSEECF